MPYVICEPCIGVKDRSCVEECPVDCIYEGEDQLYIHPDECVDCNKCVAACPVGAIYSEYEVPADQQEYIDKNASFFDLYSDASGGAGDWVLAPAGETR